MMTNFLNMIPPLFYKPTGRIGRVKFLAYNGIWACILIPLFVLLLTLIQALNLPYPIMLLGIPFTFYGILTPMMRRLTDLERSRWWVLLYFVPYLNFVFFLYLLFARGDDDVNEYGSPSLPSMIDKVVSCLLVSAIAMTWILSITKSDIIGSLFGVAG